MAEHIERTGLYIMVFIILINTCSMESNIKQHISDTIKKELETRVVQTIESDIEHNWIDVDQNTSFGIVW